MVYMTYQVTGLLLKCALRSNMELVCRGVEYVLSSFAACAIATCLILLLAIYSHDLLHTFLQGVHHSPKIFYDI